MYRCLGDLIDEERRLIYTIEHFNSEILLCEKRISKTENLEYIKNYENQIKGFLSNKIGCEAELRKTKLNMKWYLEEILDID